MSKPCRHPRLASSGRCKDCQVIVDIRQKRSKYGNRRVFLDGVWFDSAKEARRSTGLKLDPEVEHLVRQMEYELIVNGVLICSYRADFVYMRNGKKIVEDAKPKSERFKKTKAYQMFLIKKRLMKAVHGI